jgi:hypothetical protein
MTSQDRGKTEAGLAGTGTDIGLDRTKPGLDMAEAKLDRTEEGSDRIGAGLNRT